MQFFFMQPAPKAFLVYIFQWSVSCSFSGACPGGAGAAGAVGRTPALGQHAHAMEDRRALRNY